MTPEWQRFFEEHFEDSPTWAIENIPLVLKELKRLQAAAESALKWTKEIPTVAGWYWHRSDAITAHRGQPVLVQCWRVALADPNRPELEWIWPDGSGGYPIDDGGEWAGPLTPPGDD